MPEWRLVQSKNIGNIVLSNLESLRTVVAVPVIALSVLILEVRSSTKCKVR